MPVTTLADWDALDLNEVVAGHLSAEKADPEPGGNHSRSFHHGWRTRMMDLGEIPCPPEHDRVVRAAMDRERIARGEKPRWPNNMKVMK